MTEILAKEHWNKVLTDLQDHVGEEVFNLWLRNTLIVRLEPELIEVGVPNLVVSDWLKSQYTHEILDSVNRVVGYRPGDIKYSVNGHLFRQLRKQEETARRAAGEPSPTARNRAKVEPAPKQIFNLNERYTLDRVIVGPNNQLAFNCAWEVARKPGESFNPLFIFGRTGVGKTHLLQGIAREVLERFPSKETLYIPAEYFVNQYVQSLQKRDVEPFRQRFRNLDILIIDDLHFLAGKDASQQELLHTLNALEQSGKQVLLASDQHPRDLEEFMEHLTTRFMQGMIAEIELPPRNTRLAIINSKLEGHRQLFPVAVIEFLADKLECNVREMEGYVTRLVALAGLTGEKVTLQLAEQALQDFLSSRSRMVDLTDIENVVIAHYGVSSAQLHSRLRKRPVALARQVCMFLARRLTSYSLKEIGRFFGGKNHTTVVFAVQAIEEKVKKSAALNDEVEHLRRTLMGDGPNTQTR
ncbi:MAG: chromosomal replication initiator protein DnaA [Planctomycetes bacterium]|nr:chromosomal replication initiator protein DnaA [Planctomycetota bacterium]MCA8935585.1 chromosomal replication initiator protein DnaA [Planctomycetota bacterium]MCA8946780.1 chromosomal replication initiator protein DnaA [Planctomycetota bacterium]